MMRDLFQSFRSKKLIVMMLSIAIVIINDVAGNPLSNLAMFSALSMCGVYILGQGIADAGTTGAATAIRRAISQGVDVAESVKSVLGSGNKNLQYIYDDEEGPHWSHITSLDDEDKPKDIMG